MLAYEACLMGTYENAYDVRNLADYLFFFPTISYTNDASYPAYLRDPGFTATTTGRALGDIMFNVYLANVTSKPYAMSLVDSAQINNVNTAVNNWANALLIALPTAKSKIALARASAQKVDSNDDQKLTDADQMLDLWDLADKLAAQGIAVAPGNALKAAIDTAVIHNANRSDQARDYSHTHGLTLFWPQTASGWYQAYVGNQIYSATQDGSWGVFLQAYFGTDGGRPGMQVDAGPVERESATNTFYLPIVSK